MDEARQAVLLVYSQLASYAIIAIGAFTLFKIAFDISIPILGVMIFSTLTFVNLISFWLLKKAIEEARLMPYFLFSSFITTIFLVVSFLLVLKF